jgi:hypothetical protein
LPATPPSISEAWDKDSVGWQVVVHKGKHFRARSYRKPVEAEYWRYIQIRASTAIFLTLIIRLRAA